MTRSWPLSDTIPAASGDGIWRVVADELVFEAVEGVGAPVVLVPSEEVLLLTAELPVEGRRQRMAALPFAVEERIAQPLGEVHVALGAELAPNVHLAGIVSHRTMLRWAALTAAAGLERAALVPDVMMLPVPPEGAWGVAINGGRARVRLPDGSGFVLPEAQLDAAARAAGIERLLPAGALDPALLEEPALDLRQGAYARPRPRASLIWRRAALIAVAGLAAHGAIAAADTLAMRHIAGQRSEAARATLARVVPSAAGASDLSSAVADLAPPSSGPSRFLPLLSRVALALKPLGPSAALRSADYNGASDTLAIEVESSDQAGLDRVTSTLTGAGLRAQAGAATVTPGKAVGSFLIRGSA